MEDSQYVALSRAMVPGMYRVAYSILENRQDAEDAVQQTLLNAWQHRQKARAGAEKAWIMRILINASYDLSRRRRRTVPAAEVELGGAPAPGIEQIGLRDAIQSLPDILRTPFLLKYMEGMSEKEIASALRIPVSSVKSRLYRARDALQKALGEEGAQ